MGWACLADLYHFERTEALNPLPDPEGRARTATDRALELDPACQNGWRQIAIRHQAERDLHGLRMAAERVVRLNPLSVSVPFVGMLLAYAGNWDRGTSLIRRAMHLNRQHAGWYRLPLAADHYRQGEFEAALTHAKAANMPHAPAMFFSIAAAAGQLGRSGDAVAAITALRRHDPARVDLARAREIWRRSIWDEALVERGVEGFEKALALTESAAGSTASTPSAKPSSGMSSTGRPASIAVLPFTDLSAAKDQEWFCDGIAEEILNTLSQLKGLTAAARASAFSFRGRGDDLAAIGEKLHVATVLDGSVRRASDRLRITVRLSDVANGYQIWSERYDRDVKDIFDVQDEIAQAVAERLRVGLVGDAVPRVVRHTGNQEAYDLYLRGRHLWSIAIEGRAAPRASAFRAGNSRGFGLCAPVRGTC